MTIVKAFTAVDFFDGSAGFYGDVTASSTLIRIGDNYGNSNDYYGTYSYDANGNDGQDAISVAYMDPSLTMNTSYSTIEACSTSSITFNQAFLAFFIRKE